MVNVISDCHLQSILDNIINFMRTSIFHLCMFSQHNVWLVLISHNLTFIFVCIILTWFDCVMDSWNKFWLLISSFNMFNHGFGRQISHYETIVSWKHSNSFVLHISWYILYVWYYFHNLDKIQDTYWLFISMFWALIMVRILYEWWGGGGGVIGAKSWSRGEWGIRNNKIC